ncbi:hypothetical protein PG994_008145 [Apiospora phragmitis]|uniref:Uncharacterized protein n=1 Tax=Apiospora phragmitis TaxID=2905665 RepID=A0ABR1US75_9PEZI
MVDRRGNDANAGCTAVMSGDLKYKRMRLYQHLQLARPIMARILAESAFIYLKDEDKAAIREQVETCVRDDINMNLKTHESELQDVPNKVDDSIVDELFFKE